MQSSRPPARRNEILAFLAASTTPACSTPAPTGRGAAKPSSSQGSDLLPGGPRPQRTTRGSSRLKQKAAAAEASASQEDMLAVSHQGCLPDA